MIRHIEGPAGRLEALLDEPAWGCHIGPVRGEGSADASEPGGPPRVAVVIAHPHPLYGGTMHTKAVYQIAKGLCRTRAAVLRFNFRGVGRSEGLHDHGHGEQEDARAALDEMAARFPRLPLLLGGFSFGSAVALRVAACDSRVQAVLALGYPLRRGGDTAPLGEVRQPRLFVQGEHDEFGPGEELRGLVLTLPPPCEVVIVPGADHYFTGQLEPLHAAIAGWATRRPWSAA
jgi:hypothetical protein